MSTTQGLTDIFNMALSLCGEDGRLSSPTEENKLGDDCRLFWPQARRFCLALYNWDFALKRATLAKHVDAPAFEYGTQFILPADFIRLAYEQGRIPGYGAVGGGSHDIYGLIPEYLHDGYNHAIYDDVRIEGDYLLTQSDSCKILYIADTETVGRYSPEFIELAQLKLAELMAFRITGSASRRSELAGEFHTRQHECMSVNSAQSKPLVIRGAAMNSNRFKV